MKETERREFKKIADLRKGHISKRRNPLIADLFRRIEMVEAWGRGMPLILKHEPDVKFREMADIFIAAFDRPSYQTGFVAEHSSEVAEGLIERLVEDTDSTTQETTQEKILVLLKARPDTTRNELAVEIGITPDLEYAVSVPGRVSWSFLRMALRQHLPVDREVAV